MKERYYPNEPLEYKQACYCDDLHSCMDRGHQKNIYKERLKTDCTDIFHQYKDFMSYLKENKLTPIKEYLVAYSVLKE